MKRGEKTKRTEAPVVHPEPPPNSLAFQSAFQKTCDLCATFAANEARYLSPGYQEAEVRKDFIDKFFIALGWDVNHDQQTNPYEQEVKVESPVAASGSRRADYAFRLRPNFEDVRFFVEAKKPFGDIATAQNYFQANRYGWNKGTPLALLTDFEQFHVIDCRYRPDIDQALHRGVLKLHYRDLTNPEKFALLYWLFSREAVADGSLEKRARELPKPRGKAVQRGLFAGGYQSLDEAFLEQLDTYREDLAKALKKYHEELDGEALTEITQRILDRLVFMRFLEDKGIEGQRFVEKFGDKGSAWEDFLAASRRLDGIYNGIIFKPHPVFDQKDFALDEESFADLCEDISRLNSPYDFNNIPIHILGSIYERFLGRVIVATEKRVRVDDKPEVRKAGGVFYTPKYIVTYIVENTVGKLIEGKTPAQIAGLRFADIACGSGSFLLGVFDILLRYHAKWYNDHPERAQKAGCVQKDDGGWHLSLGQRRQILVNNIYGVDIDHQACEVAQLSLYLKLLEDETTASARSHQLEFKETLLPNLSKNIVCGNSLIGRDILTEQLFASDEERKLNPMDFADAFPHVFRPKPGSLAREATIGDSFELEPQFIPATDAYTITRKADAAKPPKPISVGFDAIVGNPPYGALNQELSIAYLRREYRSVANSLDTFIMFTEKASDLLREGGNLGYIIPSGLASTPSCRKLRAIIVEELRPESFVSLPYDVFKGAYIDALIFTASKLPKGQTWRHLVDTSVRLTVFPLHHQIQNVLEFSQFEKTGDFRLWLGNPSCDFLITASKEEAALVAKLRSQKFTFESMVDVMRGIEIYHPGPMDALIRPMKAFTGEMRRYSLRHGQDGFVDFTEEIAASKPLRFFTGPRILLRQLVSRKFRLQATLSQESFLTNQSVQSLIPRASGKNVPSLEAILAVLNSTLISWNFAKLMPSHAAMISQKPSSNRPESFHFLSSI